LETAEGGEVPEDGGEVDSAGWRWEEAATSPTSIGVAVIGVIGIHSSFFWPAFLDTAPELL